MPNTEAALQYGLALRGKICYSMSNRLGAVPWIAPALFSVH